MTAPTLTLTELRQGDPDEGLLLVGPSLGTAVTPLWDACAQQLPDGLPAGQAIATPAGRLSADWVIHTVGPNRHAGQTDPEVLVSCYAASLSEAQRVGAATVAFPAIGAGVYGWSAAETAEAAGQACGSQDWDGIDEVRFVLFSPDIHTAYAHVFTEADG